MATEAPFSELSTEELVGRIRGEVLEPGDAGYDDARAVWNGMVDRRPAVIVRCRGAADVMAAIDFARERDLVVSVRGGGHNVAGKAVCDSGLMIDLSPMNGVRIDPETKTARVGPGARLGDFDHEAQAFGLATTAGVDSRTGVAGLTLGGGIGFLARTHGLALDNLIAADVVTAEGELVRASEERNEDLFWGLRGGGGNFGVVTSFEFRLHDVGPEVATAQVFHPFEDAGEVLRFYRGFMADAPDEVCCYALIVRVPPAPPFAEEDHGRMAVALVACYSGDAEEGNALLQPLAEFGDPILAAVEPMPYAMLQKAFDAAYPDGERYYWKSCYMDEISDDAIETLVDRGSPLPGAYSAIFFEAMGGAIDRVGRTATAYPHRGLAYNLGLAAGWSDPAEDEEMIEWVRQIHEAMLPFSTGGIYANYLDRDDDHRVRAAFGENYDRLVEVKNAWDPGNLFRMNQNVEPTV